MILPARPDRILNDEAIGNEDMESIYHALRPLDAVAHEMEMKWGVDRLPSLVSVDMAAKFGTAQAQLDQAIDAQDSQMVVQKAKAMIRGWQALDEHAHAAGNTIMDQASVWSWSHPDTGKGFAITIDTASARRAQEQCPGAKVYTLDEVCRVLGSDQHNLVNEVKDMFPGAEVVAVKTTEKFNDKIPF